MTSQSSSIPMAITEHRIIREVDIPQFCSECDERSVCLIVGEKRKCFCPPDYYGKFCEQPIHKLPETCTKTECENGGICQQGSGRTACVCPVNYVGMNCSRVALWIQVEMNINGIPVNWDELNKTEAEISDAACKNLVISIQRGRDPVLATSIIDCNLKHFEKTKIADLEGMRLRVLLKFDPGYNETAFDAANVRKDLEISPHFSSFVGGDFSRDKTINITICKTARPLLHARLTVSAIHVSAIDSTPMVEPSKGSFQDDIAIKIMKGLKRGCGFLVVLDSFMSGFSLGCLIIVPALIAALAVFFYYRRYQAQRAWITPSNDDSDSMELVSAQHPKYNA
ncbi:hypothetical protein ACTXT7_004384 [Hymenolepis weldensis]